MYILTWADTEGPARQSWQIAARAQEVTPVANLRALLPAGNPASSPAPCTLTLDGVAFEVGPDDVARVRDVGLAVWLDFSRPRDIRKLIARLVETGQLSGVRMRATVARIEIRPGVTRSATGDDYWLTREQALFVAARSETPKACAVLQTIVRAFVMLQDHLEGRAAAPLAKTTMDPYLAAALELVGPVDPRAVRAVELLPAPRTKRLAARVAQLREAAALLTPDVPRLAAPRRPQDIEAMVELTEAAAIAEQVGGEILEQLGARLREKVAKLAAGATLEELAAAGDVAVARMLEFEGREAKGALVAA